jgi:hypothetical protein
MLKAKGGPICKSCFHPCLRKIFFDVSSNRVDISTKRSRCYAGCRGDHKRSVAVERWMTCIREYNLLLKILSFLHSHNGQITAITPTLLSNLNLGSTPSSQLPKIFEHFVVDISRATWMADHTDPTNLHWMNKCFYGLIVMIEDTLF